MIVERPGPYSEDELLAYIRGDAAPELFQRIEDAKAQDATLRAEIAAMRGIREALRTEDAGNPPGEFAWRKLETQIKREMQSTQKQSRPSGTMTLWKAAAVFLAVAVLGQGAYIATIGTGSDEPLFPTATKVEEKYVLALGFAQGAEISQITGLLQQVNARIVDGPGASGLYRVSFASENAREEARGVLETSALIELVAVE
jgi:hypothetical protein